MKIVIIWSMVIGMLNADLFTEPPPIQLSIESNQPSGTLIGSIKSYSSVQMQPPYYIVPIVPDNQELFNKDISIDSDTGDIVSNAVLNSDRIKQYKFSALSINEGLANLVIINVNSRLEPTKNKQIKENSEVKRLKATKCLDLNPNSIVKIESDDNCFQIKTEPVLDLAITETCSPALNWIGLFIIKCNQESDANLIYLNRYLIEGFQLVNSNDSTFANSEINEFRMKTNNDETSAAVEFECSTEIPGYKLNLILKVVTNQTVSNETKFFSVEQFQKYQKKDNILESYLERYNKSKIIIVANLRSSPIDLYNCSEPIVSSLNESTITSTFTSEVLNSTNYSDEKTLENNHNKTNLINQSVKICLAILSVTLVILLVLIYSLFFWHRKNNLKNSTDQQQMNYNSSSLANLALKSQTSTMSSKSNELNANNNEKQRSSYFSLMTSNSPQINLLDDKEAAEIKHKTIKLYPSSHESKNFTDQTQQKLENSVLFSYSNGYLAQIGINMMENIRSLDTRTKYATNGIYQDSILHSSSSAAVAGAGATNEYPFLLLDQFNPNTINSNDECLQRWCNMLDWKPEFNEISCVLNDLLLLNDLPK